MIKTTFQFLILYWIFLSLSITLLTTCSKENVMTWPVGKLSQKNIQNITGFPDQIDSLLRVSGLNREEFIQMSTDSAWGLNDADKTTLKNFRNRLPYPDNTTVLQKIIPLQDVAVYMNNTYKGTIGGFFSVASDIKTLKTMHEIYYGLRLDYNGSKFLSNGAGYAVIRFTSSFTDQTSIPYCVEMGGNKPHLWPGTGGGFTSSTLGEGGYPEYCFANYFPPDQGAELYEVTPKGNEILRATFQNTEWTTTEPSEKGASTWINPVRNGVYGMLNNEYKPVVASFDRKIRIQNQKGEWTDYHGTLVYIETNALYMHNIFRVWGLNESHYLLTTKNSNLAKKLNFTMDEPGTFSKTISTDQADSIFEEINQHPILDIKE